MIKKLLAFGCSNTFGSECIQDGDHISRENVYFSYAKFLADMLGCSEYENYAYPGKSNLYIASDVYKHIGNEVAANNNASQELFVVIGWSEVDRLPFFFHNEGKNPVERTVTEYILHGIYNKELFATFGHGEPQTIKEIKSILQRYPFAEQFMKGVMLYLFGSPTLHTNAVLLKAGVSNFLLRHNIKFLTFPTLVSLPSINESTALGEKDPRHLEQTILCSCKNNIPEWRHAETVYEAYMGSDFAINFNMFEKFKEYGVSKVQGHLKPAAHMKLAEFLFNEIKSRGIV